MDIGKISGSSAGNLTNEATQSAAQASDDSFAKKLEAAANGNDDKELKKACQEFESIMLSMMYKSMKASITKSDLIEEDAGTEIFESMQDDNLMEQASKTGSLGLAESLYKQLSKNSGTGAKNVNKDTVQQSEPVSEKSGE
jgi:peptidoglycan hydrolase FlgJ